MRKIQMVEQLRVTTDKGAGSRCGLNRDQIVFVMRPSVGQDHHKRI